MHEVLDALRVLRTANPQLDRPRPAPQRPQRLGKVLIADRGEIAKRFFFALKEEGIASVAIVTDVDRTQSWAEFADEVVYLGEPQDYTNVPVVLAAVLLSGANAVYPGYGALSKDPDFVESLARLGDAYGREIVFMGPPIDVMRRVGTTSGVGKLAHRSGLPVYERSEGLVDLDAAKAAAARIGYPVVLQRGLGGGNEDPVLVRTEPDLAITWLAARPGGRAHEASVLETYVERPVHVEVQIFNGTALGVRQCAVLRRKQKVIEETGDYFLEPRSILKLLAAAEGLAEASGYADGGGAGTVEFVLDAATGTLLFVGIHARLQVAYAVTDQSLRIDLAKWQILHFDGRDQEIPYEDVLRARFADKDHAIECRIYAEDPWNNFVPSPGVIQDLELPTFNGIRCDFGFKKGDTILPDYDPMIGKVVARGRTRRECLLRLERALGELYVRGIITNVDLLLKIVRHPEFRSGTYTDALLGEPELQSPEVGDERPVNAAVFAALAELTRGVHDALGESLASGDLEAILAGGRLDVFPAFYAEVHEQRVRVDFLQIGLDRYATFVNSVHYGEIGLSARVVGADDVLLLFRGRSYQVRIDRRPAFHVLRVREEDGIHYYRVRLQSAVAGRRVDPPGTVRSPFQGSFVSFARDHAGGSLRLGSRVEQGEPLVVIEAMKMETALPAPVSGTVTYLVENGDHARLVRGRTSQGLVIGKPLAEGEILAIVDDGSETEVVDSHVDTVSIDADEHDLLGRLRDPGSPDGGLIAAVRQKGGQGLVLLLDLVRGSLLGYLHDEHIVRRLQDVLTNLARDEISMEAAAESLADIIEVYANLKQLYSPALAADQSWFGEMNRLVVAWNDETYTPPEFLLSVLSDLLKHYGITWWFGKRTADMRRALYHMLRGYSAIQDGRPLVEAVLGLCRARALATPRLVAAIRRLVQQEQYERDDTLAAIGRSYLARTAAVEQPDEARAEAEVSWVPLDDADAFRTRALAALEQPEPDEIPAGAPGWVKRELAEHVRRWSLRWRVHRLPSPFQATLAYRLQPLAGGAHRCAMVGWVEHGGVTPDLEPAATTAMRSLAFWDGLDHGEHNIVDVLACEQPVQMDLAAMDVSAVRGDRLRELAERVIGLIPRVVADWLLFELDVVRAGVGSVERKVLNGFVRKGRVSLDLLDDGDRTSPLWNGVLNEGDQRVFDRNKWPVERWVRECLDAGSASEIIVDSIDRPAGGHDGAVAVGAKIYEGLIGGRPAVFFLKDSRVAGGATGDLEGRKYVAACYYAYLADRPLYVWNDGAGANVRQGLVSLNRAAEGFMMNALVAGRVTYERFLSTLRAHEDPVVPALCAEMDRAFGLADRLTGREGPQAFVLVAVGVGSSTGLDVYGSSQAAIQVMLDAEESYRTLTGASVIRTVTGEALTNYEIGGARVMGQWTGTVDVVARDRVDLLALIRTLHETFAPHAHRARIARPPAQRVLDDGRAAGIVLTERVLQAHVDGGVFVPFKGEYLEAGALVGGFARVGGKHVLVMGPRTAFGIRSYGSVLKARDLLKIANKTGSPKVLVLGGKWYRELGGEDEMAIRARTDFVRLLFAPGPPQVNLVTDPEGLALVALNSQADAVIYVRRPGESAADRRLASRAATFETSGLEEAFDLANRVLGLLQRSDQPPPFEPPHRHPVVPEETTRPFDMVTNVIEALVDEGSFLEYHRQGHEQGASTLVTGLGTLAGNLVGVIADQPLRGGAPDAPGTEKFRVFMEFLDRREIPLVMLSNAPGFVPGAKQERLRIQQIGGESLDVNVLSRVPVVSVVLNQNFGGRQIHAFSRFLRPGVAYIALDRAILAVMGAPAAFDLFHGARYREMLAHGDREDADRFRNEFLEDFNRKSRATGDAMRTGVLNWTVPAVNQLRDHVVRALDLARAKCGIGGGAMLSSAPSPSHPRTASPDSPRPRTRTAFG